LGDKADEFESCDNLVAFVVREQSEERGHVFAGESFKPNRSKKNDKIVPGVLSLTRSADTIARLRKAESRVLAEQRLGIGCDYLCRCYLLVYDQADQILYVWVQYVAQPHCAARPFES